MGVLMKNGQKLSVTDSFCPQKKYFITLSSQTGLLTLKITKVINLFIR